MLWNATIVIAFEIGLRVAGWTVFNLFVAVVTTVVFAVAEQPFRYAAVIRLPGTALPAGGAVALAAHVRRLIGIIAAIVIEVTHPLFRYATSVLATELRFRITGTFMADIGILVAAVLAIGIAITTPTIQNATAVRFAFEVRLGTG